MPLPVRATGTEGLLAFEARYSVAFVVPAVVGVNATDKFALPPAGRE